MSSSTGVGLYTRVFYFEAVVHKSTIISFPPAHCPASGDHPADLNAATTDKGCDPSGASLVGQRTMGPGPGLVARVLWLYCMRLASLGPRPPALATLLQYYCTIIGQYTTSPPDSRLCAIHQKILALTISCKGQIAAPNCSPVSHTLFRRPFFSLDRVNPTHV